MDTPVAHCLVGLSIFCFVRRTPVINQPGGVRSLVIILLIAANLPDFDFLPGLLFGSPEKFHRQFSHSIAFCLMATAALLIYLKLARIQASIFISALWFTAIFSHLAIDWISLDVAGLPGIELWWPVSEHRYIADPVLFLGARRNEIFSELTVGYNLFAITWELLILVPVLALSSFLSDLLAAKRHRVAESVIITLKEH